ncbi:hypothetical protein PVAP13_4NG234300 [Panicum virgatum]|uniref:Uncharacterized protein n=1 Tax=Panicum virgatum TaxID=38727 RepID=A0A8T0TDX0_PANVG|nr:hypothetical protein PVAP13_4NG234300 [Panicum virgatum]
MAAAAVSCGFMVLEGPSPSRRSPRVRSSSQSKSTSCAPGEMGASPAGAMRSPRSRSGPAPRCRRGRDCRQQRHGSARHREKHGAAALLRWEAVSARKRRACGRQRTEPTGRDKIKRRMEG